MVASISVLSSFHASMASLESRCRLNHIYDHHFWIDDYSVCLDRQSHFLDDSVSFATESYQIHYSHILDIAEVSSHDPQSWLKDQINLASIVNGYSFHQLIWYSYMDYQSIMMGEMELFGISSFVKTIYRIQNNSLRIFLLFTSIDITSAFLI